MPKAIKKMKENKTNYRIKKQGILERETVRVRGERVEIQQS